MRFENELGYIHISKKVVADITAYATMSCYGVVGMAHQRGRDGLIEILRGRKISKGVKVEFNDKDEANIDVYVILEQAIKISVVAENIIDAIKYNVERQTGIKVASVTVNVVSIRM